MSRGFVLVEVAIAYLVLTLALTALVPAFIMAVKANKSTEKIQASTDLAAELLEEVRLRRWDETTPTPVSFVAVPSTIGLDTGESASNKTTFDDVDDFHGWSENGAVDPIMRSLPAFAGYQRTVDVAYVDSSMSPSGATTDYKRVTVCAATTGLSPICLTTVLTNR